MVYSSGEINHWNRLITSRHAWESLKAKQKQKQNLIYRICYSVNQESLTLSFKSYVWAIEYVVTGLRVQVYISIELQTLLFYSYTYDMIL
jgi:hypothetical protein